MKPYLNILVVLLVGGSIGYFIGQRTNGPSNSVPSSSSVPSDDRALITDLLNRQKEAYAAHDELLLYRDCAATYVEINASTGEVFDLQKAIVHQHEDFRPGKTVTLLLGNLDIVLIQNSAAVRGTYSKTSDQYEQQGFAGLTGEVVWFLSKYGARWRIAASLWGEERKR